MINRIFGTSDETPSLCQGKRNTQRMERWHTLRKKKEQISNIARTIKCATFYNLSIKD